ncbi:MAG: hypothetical protein GY944_28085 [bacterium]|nr:hypothetical protein [bacterium]
MLFAYAKAGSTPAVTALARRGLVEKKALIGWCIRSHWSARTHAVLLSLEPTDGWAADSIARAWLGKPKPKKTRELLGRTLLRLGPAARATLPLFAGREDRPMVANLVQAIKALPRSVEHTAKPTISRKDPAWKTLAKTLESGDQTALLAQVQSLVERGQKPEHRAQVSRLLTLLAHYQTAAAWHDPAALRRLPAEVLRHEALTIGLEGLHTGNRTCINQLFSHPDPLTRAYVSVAYVIPTHWTRPAYIQHHHLRKQLDERTTSWAPTANALFGWVAKTSAPDLAQHMDGDLAQPMDGGIEQLLEDLEHGDDQALIQACEQLARSPAHATRAAPLLCKLLAHPRIAIRTGSQMALRQVGAAAANDIAAALSELEGRPRSFAVNFLIEHDRVDTRVIKEILTYYAPRPSEKAQLESIVRRLRKAQYPLLAVALENEALTSVFVDALVAADRKQIKTFFVSVLPRLEQRFDSLDLAHQIDVAQLAVSARPQASASLVRFLEHEHAEVRAAASLWSRGSDSEALAAMLRRLLHDPSTKVRLNCAQALRSCADDPEVYAALRKAFSDSAPKVRAAALLSLLAAETLDADRQALARKGLLDSDLPVQSAAALSILRRRNSPAELRQQADNWLTNGLASTDIPTLLTAVHAVASVADPAPYIADMIRALHHPNRSVVGKSVWALGHIGPPAKAALPKLRELEHAGNCRAARTIRDIEKN